MATSLNAADPRYHVTVHASAGTGKTWLLVTRIVRLLLSGARPEGILALTFTRKAAAEMQSRVNQRLRELARADAPGLDAQLADMGLEPDPQLRNEARRLYERLLFSEQPLRTATFHSFCQDLLQRFPLEAAVPPGFELLEAGGKLEQEAMDALFTEATRNNTGAPAQALEQLFDGCNGLANTRRALFSFLSHRSDWWAYTAERDPLGHATKRLSDLLAVDPTADPVAGFFDATRQEQLREFAQLLGRHHTKTNDAQQQSLHEALHEDKTPQQRLACVTPVFLTNGGEPRQRKPSAAQARSMGEAGQQRLLVLHTTISGDLLDIADRLMRQRTWRLNRAWFTAGAQLLQHYQRLKRELRLLDFADLEWHSYRLLTIGGNAHWVQYKLDARIDHLLVDEFQDTNPTQWRLILPLLEELAAGEPERPRSVFIVGDAKQSIYRFRRANAALLNTASDWMEAHLAARSHTLDASWRSAPAIIQCVNQVFSTPALQALMPDFNRHDTHRRELWGRVECSPLFESPATAEPAAGPELRNPLQQPRCIAEELRHHEEGCWIAQRIRGLREAETLIGAADQARPVQYGDMVILLRARTHAHAYEEALRAAGIPYLGAGRGTLMDSLEVRDMEALLNTLVTPYNNLALAQVLRSPIFAVSNEELVQLAQARPGPWIERLQRLAATSPRQNPLVRAHELLQQWRELAGHTPVHDLLDRIYHDADIPARYRSAYPAPLRPRVSVNLTRFIELALDVDSGRYPSLPRFLSRLQTMRDTEVDAPDETPPESGSSTRVRIMTIHGAKGLEAPVVFLADTAATTPRQRAYQAAVEWPAKAARPGYFLLATPKSARDRISTRLLQQQQQPEAREEANLLYVALTRATQMLFISGSAARRRQEADWYHTIRAGLTAAGARQREDDALVLESGTPPEIPAVSPMETIPGIPCDPRLSKPMQIQPLQREIAPSLTVDTTASGETVDSGARRRGVAIHAMLEYLASHRDAEIAGLLPQLTQQLALSPDDSRLLDWWEEACRVWNEPRFAVFFRSQHYLRAYSEVPVQYLADDGLVHGIIDRLVDYGQEALIIDYKTHAYAGPGNVRQLAREYAGQLHLYAAGVRRIWPDKTVRAGVLFTACNELVTLEKL